MIGTAGPRIVGRPTFIDLFCGCGGFTLGMLRAGFECLAAIDSNPEAIQTLKANLVDKSDAEFPPVRHALLRDLTQYTPHELAAMIGTNHLDAIVGGPPCQGFSMARQRDGSNHGTQRLKEDPRRHLFRNYLDHVEFFQPKVFVIENVLGLRSAAGGRYFTAVQHEARTLGQAKGLPGYRVHAQIEHAEELGVPQKRRRLLIVGVRADLPIFFPTELKPADRAQVGTMLGDAIMDLPKLGAGQGTNRQIYDLGRRNAFIERHGNHFLYKVAEANHTDTLHNHTARPHSARDLRDFAKIGEGETSAELMRQGVIFEFPYDTSSFKDRYTRQHRAEPCSTIVAHLAKDGLMFIHPTQNRSFTPREAARVQTFPDWFIFPEARTHSFRVIGNAVPPLIGEAVGNAVMAVLRSQAGLKQLSAQAPDDTIECPAVAIQPPDSETEALAWLLTVAQEQDLRRTHPIAFLKAWYALFWLLPELHPEGALDHGPEQHHCDYGNLPEALTHRYSRSGWPVCLESFGKEAWRRLGTGAISHTEFQAPPVSWLAAPEKTARTTKQTLEFPAALNS